VGAQSVSIVFSSALVEIVEQNQSFDMGKLRVAYTGANHNGSYISKEAFERAIPTIYNCPVVCNYNRDADEIGSHDIEIVNSEDGLRLVNITQPCGIVPESASYSWETFTEEDGTVNEYLVVDVLLWKRQEVYEKIKNDGITKESMEITVLDGETVDGVYVINDFEFTAFCLLGTAEPCFESAALIMFSKTDFRKELFAMVSEMKEVFAKSREPDGVGDIDNSTERGEKPLDERHELMAKYNLTEDMLDFSLDEFTLEELQEKFESIAQQKADEAFALAEQFREELMGALSVEVVETFYGEACRYCYVDYDPDSSEVYAYDRSDWKLYGFTYSTDGDAVKIDFDSKKRKKFAIVDFDEGEPAFSFAAVMDEVSAAFEQKDSDWSEKYSALETEKNELQQFKDKSDADAAQAERDEMFEQFSELAGIEEYDNLRNAGATDLTIEEIQEKCFAIKGKYQRFSVKPTNTPKLPINPVEPTDEEDDPYGGIFRGFKK